jgi:small subunit ribosomal protein S8
MLSRIRNANTAQHDQVEMPNSKEKSAIAEILKREGYIDEFEVAPAKQGSTLRITLRYGSDRSRTISGLRRISKPGLRVYAKAGKLPRVLGGMGIAIVSTSVGLLTDKEASRQKVGGEVVAYVW